MIYNKKLGRYIEHTDILQFMIDNNCKAEQDSIKAIELIESNAD